MAIDHHADVQRMLLDMADNWQRPRFPLTGMDVMQAGVAQGPDVGRLLARVEDWWIGTDFAADDPRISPLKADLTGLAPALVFTGGFDPLRDEGNEYAAALRRAGVPVEHRQFDTLPHGFASIAPLGGDSAKAIGETIAGIATHLGVVRRTRAVTSQAKSRST